MKPKSKLNGLISFRKESVIERFEAAKCGNSRDYEKCVENLKRINEVKLCEVLLDNGCNQNCRHCFLGQTRGRTPTPIETTKKVIEALKTQGYLLYPYATEPLFSEEAFNNFLFLAEPKKTHFLTNGTASLARTPAEDLINKFVSNELMDIRISLHGSTADSHEFLTKTPGTFEIVRNTIEKIGKYVDKHSMNFTLFMVVHKENMNEMEDLFAFAFENKVRHIYLLKIIDTYHSDIPRRVIMDRQATVDALLEIGRLRCKYQNKMRIELAVSWGVNFHVSGIYRYLCGIPRYPDLDGAYKTLKPLKQKFFPFCVAVAPTIAIHHSKREIYPCMANSGAPELKIGILEGENYLVEFNELGNSLLQWHKDWAVNASGECALGDCQYSELCHGGCRATAIGSRLIKGGKPDWFAPFPDCVTRILEEIS